MGSPVSVTVANLVIEDVEDRAISSYHTAVPFWNRYVDDTCTAIPLHFVMLIYAPSAWAKCFGLQYIKKPN